ncbi:cytochrome b [bacterium]|nr:cytochrome b [bacterium]
MKKQLVYDLPTRTFHWLFAGLFITAFAIAKTIDDDSPVFAYHMLAGFLLGFTVLLRLVWGVVGTKYARFASFALHPPELFAYIKGIVSGDKRRWDGHNPASSWAAIIMMGCALGLGITGYLMANGQKERFEDIHELLANGFLVVALFHIAGVVLHACRHKDGIGMAMLNGQKPELGSNKPIASARPGVALLFLVLIASFAMYLSNNYNTQNQSLQFFGSALQLGENENDEDKHGAFENDRKKYRETDDDDYDDDHDD